jgi:hypothetical protein
MALPDQRAGPASITLRQAPRTPTSRFRPARRAIEIGKKGGGKRPDSFDLRTDSRARVYQNGTHKMLPRRVRYR